MKEITALIKEKDVKTLKSILEFLREKYPSFAVFQFRTGKLGEETIVSFKVSPIFYKTILEKFAYNDLHVILKDQTSKSFIEEKKAQKKKNIIPLAQLWSDVKTNTQSTTLEDLEKFAVTGQYKEVIKASKSGLGTKQDVIDKAKNILSDTVLIAINNLYEIGKERKFYFEKTYDSLVSIASDKDLKILRKHAEMIRAGETAIDICVAHSENIEKLIELSNNSNLNNVINITAAIKFSEIIFKNEETYSLQIQKAIKFLNTKWLRIAFESTFQKFSQNDIGKFNKLVEFIEENRNF